MVSSGQAPTPVDTSLFSTCKSLMLQLPHMNIPWGVMSLYVYPLNVRECCLVKERVGVGLCLVLII